jgi:hypothetical protein
MKENRIYKYMNGLHDIKKYTHIIEGSTPRAKNT